jgi:hypothetical protein
MDFLGLASDGSIFWGGSPGGGALQAIAPPALPAGETSPGSPFLAQSGIALSVPATRLTLRA